MNLILMCLMIWAVVEANFTDSYGGEDRHYLIRNSNGELRHITSFDIKGNYEGKGHMNTFLLVGDKIEEYREGWKCFKATKYRKEVK